MLVLVLRIRPFDTVCVESKTEPEIMELFPCSTQLSMKFFLLINVKIPTTVGILTLMSGKISNLCLSNAEKKPHFLIFLYL